MARSNNNQSNCCRGKEYPACNLSTSSSGSGTVTAFPFGDENTIPVTLKCGEDSNFALTPRAFT